MNQEERKEKLKEWKAWIEHLNVQLHLGATETKEEFEIQKKRLGIWINETRLKLKDLEHAGVKNASSLKSNLEALRVQIALGKAESEDALKEQRKKISLGLQEFQRKADEFNDVSELKIKEFAQNTSDQLDDFQTRFDLFRLHFHLGKTDVQEEWDNKKKEISNNLHDLKTRLASKSEDTSEKWDDFSSEMSEAWKHMRKAFKNN